MIAYRCPECGKTWTVEDDPNEWAYGHDCEDTGEVNTMFVLRIETDNAAFADEDRAAEVARILRRAASLVEDGKDESKLTDINGNTVGAYNFG